MSGALIVGCGVTGGALARYLPAAAVEGGAIWEAMSVGGRCWTDTCRHLPLSADVGAQYYTRNDDIVDHELHKEMLSTGTLLPYPGTIVNDPNPSGSHFVCPMGMESIPRYLVSTSDNGWALSENRQVKEINTHGDGWRVVGEDGDGSKVEQNFGTIVVTPTVDAVSNIQGNFRDATPSIQWDVFDSVTYSSRYAVCLYYSPSEGLLEGMRGVEWTSMYTRDFDHMVRYVSIESRKLGLRHSGSYTDGDEAGVALTVHTSKALDYTSATEETVTREVSHYIHNMLPFLPDPTQTSAYFIEVSQVLQPYSGKPRAVASAPGEPPLILAGDSMVGSNIDKSIASAAVAARLLSP